MTEADKIVERHLRLNFWIKEAFHYIKEYKANKNDDLWILVKGCGACVCEFDRKHSKKSTREIQSFIWEEAYLRGETSFEEYYKSGYFKEEYEKGA